MSSRGVRGGARGLSASPWRPPARSCSSPPSRSRCSASCCWIAGRLGLGRLPGDILIERDGVTIFIPLGSMLLLSLLGSLVLYLIRQL